MNAMNANITGILRFNPSGDLDMGPFVSGPTP